METIEITKKHPEFANIEFLAKTAVKVTKSSLDIREYYNTIKVEADGMAVSTDSSRLHLVIDTTLEPGFYKFKKSAGSYLLFKQGKDFFPKYDYLLKVQIQVQD